MSEKKGFQSAVEALRGLAAKDQNRILADIAKTDPELSRKLRKNIFQFEDLIKANKNGLQTLLGEVTDSTLAIALRGKPKEFIVQILKNLTQRRLQSIQESIKEIGPQPMGKVQAAQQEILEKALELQSQGKIIFVDGDDPLV